MFKTAIFRPVTLLPLACNKPGWLVLEFRHEAGPAAFVIARGTLLACAAGGFGGGVPATGLK